jgi:peptidoglycan/LPS O-acetylase OafA/YrhL
MAIQRPDLNIKILKPGAYRLFLALMVLVSHSSRFDLGPWAVFSFFVLSGYWIYRMWDEKYSRIEGGVIAFYKSRFWRLFPVFWMANLLLITANALFGIRGAYGILAKSTFHTIFSNLLILGYASLPMKHDLLDAAWSLDIEIQFYLVALGIFWLFKTSNGIFWEIIVTIFCAVGLIIFINRGMDETPKLQYLSVFFLCGALAAKHQWKPSSRLIYALCIMAVLFVAVVFISPEWRFLVQNDKHGATLAELHRKETFQTFFALTTAPIALFTSTIGSGPMDKMAGDATYTLYLVQWPVMAIHYLFFGALDPVRRLPSIIGAWIIVFSISAAIYYFYDRLIRRWRIRKQSTQLYEREPSGPLV